MNISTAGKIQKCQTSSTKSANDTVPIQTIWILCIFYHITITQNNFLWFYRIIVLIILCFCRLVYCYYCCMLQCLQYYCIYIRILGIVYKITPFNKYHILFKVKLCKLIYYWVQMHSYLYSCISFFMQAAIAGKLPDFYLHCCCSFLSGQLKHRCSSWLQK